MTDPARSRMTSDEFIAWAMQRDDGRRYELVAGEVVAMAPERAAHARAKLRITRKLADVVKAAGLPCEVFADGPVVQVDAATAYEPNATVRCGEPIPDDATSIADPMIVVEVLSLSSRAWDSGAKLADYFRVPSVTHCPIITTERRTIIHHAQQPDGGIVTSLIPHDGVVRLDPPGIEIREVFG
ncbi:MAG: Uma2 family endonuclease [Acetobacteraceae bacterium]